MSKNIIALCGSYRKKGITDQAIDVMLDVVQQKGGQVEKIYLTDQQLEFCTNCRKCTMDAADKRRGACMHDDDMEKILAKIDAADGLIFASPANFRSVTAIMKRFIERLVVYAYWPWGVRIPKARVKKRCKKAVVLTSCTCSPLLGKLLMFSVVSVMKKAVTLVGAKVVTVLFFGHVCLSENQKITKDQRALAAAAGSLFM